MLSSTDASGNPETVPVAANLVGSGGVHFVGTGTFVLGGVSPYTGGNNTYSGGSFVNGCTVQTSVVNALGSGPLILSSGTVDLDGFNEATGGLSGAPGGLIANLSGTTNSTLTVSQTGSSTFAGTIADGPTNTTTLVLTGPGTLYLTGSDTYTGGTWVEGDASLIVTSPQAIADGTNLYVGNGVMASGTVPSSAPVAAASSAGGVAPVPEPGTLALLAAGAAAAVLARRRNKRTTRRIV